MKRTRILYNIYRIYIKYINMYLIKSIVRAHTTFYIILFEKVVRFLYYIEHLLFFICRKKLVLTMDSK